MKYRRRNPHGLTLIELLVVIGIIAVLASLLFPALSSTRKATANAVCVSNLRQIFQLSAIWATDNDGYVPQSQWYVTNLPTMYNNLTKYGLTTKMTICPASGLQSPTYGISSRLVTSASPQWGPGDVYFWSHGKYKLALLSPRTIFFSETAQQPWSGKAGAYISAPESAAAPHGNRGNVLYCDGHVESLGTNDLKKVENWSYGIP